eukprot:TRINITY_DN105208_c0_g1_i1.p1 TRINITY_DN105208_c0_g1~~TRINITY_DN105208_c0_g1_i1.p1  ORF type:complete len:1166 (-),score=71.16 TRINITY_DN105208_c0_g1_i1:21-3332(-)
MSTEVTARLALLLDRIKAKELTINDVKHNLDNTVPSKIGVILYYACKYLYPESAEEIQRWTQLQGDQAQLLQHLSKDAFEVAVESGLYDIAYHLALVHRPVGSPRTLLQLLEKKEYTIIRALMGNATKVGSDADIFKFAFKNNIPLAELYETYNDGNEINSYLARREEDKALFLLAKNCKKANDKSLLIALNTGCLEYAVEFAGRNIPIKENAHCVFSLLFQRISKDIDREIGNLDIYLYVIRKYMNSAEQREAMGFVEAVNLILNSKEVTLNLSKLLNPVKFIVQLIELAIQFASHFTQLKMSFDQIKAGLTKLGLDILEEVKSKQQMKAIFLDKDLENRDMLSLILRYYLIDFLNNTMAEEIANEAWNGPYNFTRNLLAPTSTLWKTIVHAKTFRKEDIENKIKEDLLTKKVESMQAHQFEFAVWKNSAAPHVLFSALEYIMVTVALFTAELSINNAYYKMDDIKGAAKGRDLTPEENVAYYHAVILARNWIFCWYTIALLILTASARFITYPLFQFLTGRGQQMINLQWAVNLVLFLTLLTMYLPYMGEATLGIQHIRVEGEELIRLAEDIKNNPYISILSAIVAFCLGLRIAYLLRYTYFFGPLITIMGFMIRKIVDFGLIFFIVLFIFSLVASLLFSPENEGFERIDYIMATLFQSSLGEFELNPPNKYSIQAKVFYVIFAFALNIMLLNFVIAILDEVYSNIAGKSYATLYNEVISLREQYKPHKTYQFMVSSYLIFDVLLCILFLPFYPFMQPNTRKLLNKTLLYLEYTFCFMIILPIYISIELVLLPISYSILILSKVCLLFKEKPDDEPFAKRAGRVLLFLVFGILILLFYVVIDVYYFTLHAYTHRPMQKADNEVDEYASMENFKGMIRYFKTCTEEELPCATVLNDLEKVFAKCSSPYMKRLSCIMWIGQFSTISHYIRQISSSYSKNGGVNLRYLYTIFCRFFRRNKLKLNVKKYFAKPYMTTPIDPQKSNEDLTMMVSQGPLVNTEISSNKIELHKNIPVVAFKYYNRKVYCSGVKNYCARSVKAGAVRIQTQEIVQHLKDLRVAFLNKSERNLGACEAIVKSDQWTTYKLYYCIQVLLQGLQIVSKKFL